MTGLRRGWFHLASGAGIGRLFGFASNLLLSRWLGPTELGLFNLITTTVQTSDTLVRCGGDYALNFELGGQPETTNTEYGAQLARGLAQLCSLMTALICIGVAIWVWLGHGLFPSSLVASQRFVWTALLLLMIACEGISASAWEVLLAGHQTSSVALRQGLFFPLRLLFAAIGALFGGVMGAMVGWSLIAVIQCVWLKTILRHLWKPLRIWPFLRSSMHQLLNRGLPFYMANLLASMIFFPLLLKVAAGSGLAEIGYLRVGQIIQQLFALLPATLVPILFLQLRSKSSFSEQVKAIEEPLRFVWALLLAILFLYCIVDRSLINLLFGEGFESALLSTRILLVTALFECLAQLLAQPLLAAGKTRIYGVWQNGAALLAAVLGWLWIPVSGLAAYLIVRLLYVVIPLSAFGRPVFKQLQEPRRTFSLVLMSLALLIASLVQMLGNPSFDLMRSVFAFLLVIVVVVQRRDLLFVRRVLRRAS